MAIRSLLLVAIFHSCLSQADSFAVPALARQAELLNLVRQDCGSCHGLTLAGGLGLPLTPEAIKDKSPEALAETILHGRGGTPMPPWKPFLTEDEAAWIVDTLLKGLP
ncbi:MAG: cytochrome c [Betaproteobacteria bacterium]|nr:cytochrome c [Betaproteobacteria bacterium]